MPSLRALLDNDDANNDDDDIDDDGGDEAVTVDTVVTRGGQTYEAGS